MYREFEDGLSFEFYRQEKGSGSSELKMRTIFPVFFSSSLIKKNANVLNKLFIYAAYKFYLKELTDGKSIIEKIKAKGYPYQEGDIMLMEYNGKSAILNTVIYHSKKLEVSPAMVIFGGGVGGFTVSPGNFSDMYINEYIGNSERLVGGTIDFIPYMASITAVFLEFYLDLVKGFIDGKLPSDFETESYNFYPTDEKYRNTIAEIMEHIRVQTAVNKAKRIDTLVVDGKTVVDLMKELDIRFRYFIPSEDILLISLKMGKPVSQVKSYIESVLEKKAV